MGTATYISSYVMRTALDAVKEYFRPLLAFARACRSLVRLSDLDTTYFREFSLHMQAEKNELNIAADLARSELVELRANLLQGKTELEAANERLAKLENELVFLQRQLNSQTASKIDTIGSGKRQITHRVGTSPIYNFNVDQLVISELIDPLWTSAKKIQISEMAQMNQDAERLFAEIKRYNLIDERVFRSGVLESLGSHGELWSGPVDIESVVKSTSELNMMKSALIVREALNIAYSRARALRDSSENPYTRAARDIAIHYTEVGFPEEWGGRSELASLLVKLKWMISHLSRS